MGPPMGQKSASKKFHQNALVLTDWGTLRVADKQEATQLVEAQARIVLVQLWSTNCFRALLKRFSSAIVPRVFSSVAAGVASSSLVVPAIPSKAVRRISFKPLRAQKGHETCPLCALNGLNEIRLTALE